MKKLFYLQALTCLLFSLTTYHFANAGVYKIIRVGKYYVKVDDSGGQSSQVFGRFGSGGYYYDNFLRCPIICSGSQIGTKDWTDENGTYWPIKISGHGFVTSDELENTMPVPDAKGSTIHKYVRYTPPSITVDGYSLEEPFPMPDDEVNPEAIPGTADVMIESWINTSMGLTIHQRVFAWSQTHHDEYIIYDWTFINTGNTDLDDVIELPDKTLKDVYFCRLVRPQPAYQPNWVSCYGEFPTDTLRIWYSYSGRKQGSKIDNLGNTLQNGYLDRPFFIGEAMIHVDKSADDHSDDPSQPQMTGEAHGGKIWVRNDANTFGAGDLQLLYEHMQFGPKPFLGIPYLEGTYPGTHHALRGDGRGLQYAASPTMTTASGPYTLAPGDSIRIVWATVAGSISPEKGWEIGSAWKAGNCTWEGPDDLAEYYPPFKQYPDLAPTVNDQAKDRWIMTGKDSLFQNAWAAQWAVRNDYNVPIPPPAPSIEVKSLPDRIRVIWGNESESVSDFAGYRVYRAEGSYHPTLSQNQLIGVWSPIYECGEGTANALTHSYDDIAAQRGVAYHYYVAAFDNGVDNVPGAGGKKEKLESGKYSNMTTRAAHLTRPAGTLSSVRVVPNPFNIDARDIQYPGEQDKIMFMDLPPECTIQIYSESGDLVKTLEHTDGSGDEPWGVLSEEQSATDSGQIIVSGIYIAYIKTPDGESTFVKFIVVR